MFGRACFVLFAPIAASLFLAATPIRAAEPIATYSIVGYDPETGELGVAVQSKFFAVGAVVPYAEAGAGAIASQAFCNATYGPRGLAMLREGQAPEAVIAALLADDAECDQRQVGIVDAQGRASSATGAKCTAWAGHRTGDNYAAQGNILTGDAVVDAMAETFESTDAMLGEKLMRALEAGQAAGGDSRGMQSAAILVVKAGAGYGGYNDRYCDLRVDDHANPIAEMRRIFDMWRIHALILEGYRHAEAQAWDRAIAAGTEAARLDDATGEPQYHLGCYFSKAGRRDEALAALGAAIQRDATLAPRAAQDPDFEPLYADPDFVALVAAGRAAGDK